MDGTKNFLKLVRPADWPDAYEKVAKLATDIVGLEWPQRTLALSEELIQLVHEPFGPRGAVLNVRGEATGDWAAKADDGVLSRSAEQTALSGKILVTAVLLHIDGLEKGDIGVPTTVEHALTLTLTLVPVWGNAAQILLERRDDECDDVLTALPGYMLMMLADDFGKPSSRRDRVRAIWRRGLSVGYRNGPYSLAIH